MKCRMGVLAAAVLSMWVAPVRSAEVACGTYGTSVRFVPGLSRAADQARQSGKLLMILHVSGHFEDPGFT